MSYIYRYTDLLRWGAGKDARLSSADGDDNTWYTQTRIEALEARPLPQPAISSFSISGEFMYVHFADDSMMGPYQLPVAQYTSPGDGTWQPLTHYVPLQTFSVNGGFYAVNIEHDSAASFDPGANDGDGHEYYTLMFQAPGQTIPTGGAVGQIIYKTGSGDFQIGYDWRFPAGTTGKFLRYKSSTRDDVEAATPEATEIHYTATLGSGVPSGTVGNALELLSGGSIIDAGGIPFTPATGSGLLSSTVEDAINELASGGTSTGRQTMWIPAAAMSPLLTGGAEPGSFETATYKNLIKTMDFDPDTYESVQFEIVMPKSWDRGDLAFKIFWSHGATISVFTTSWEIDASTFGITSDFDKNISANRVFFDSIGGTADRLVVSDETDPVTVFDADTGVEPVFGDMLMIRVSRNGDDVTDTLAVDARLHGIHIYYNTTAATDN